MLYKYKCDICNNVYVGKTKRHLIVPQYEHLGKEIATDKFLRYSDKDATAIRKQCHSLDHLASIDKFSILGNAMNNYHASLKESLLILKLKPSLNETKEPIPLYLFDNDSEYYYCYYYYIQGFKNLVHVHSCAPKASIRYTKMCALKNVIIFIYTLKSLYFLFS